MAYGRMCLYVSLVLALLLAVYAGVRAEYAQDTVATINPMTSSTVEAAPSGAAGTRTIIGIGEQVVCSVDSNTWSDFDCDEDTNQSVEDTIGARVWACSAGGVINPTGSTTSNTTTMTAGMTPTAEITVSVEVYDSTTKFPDDAVKSQIKFTSIAPTSHTYEVALDNPAWTAWTTGTKYLGARTFYEVTVNPTYVCFCNVQFRENYGTGTTANWPDSSVWSTPTGTSSFSVNVHNKWYGYDEASTGLYDSNKLYTGEVWQDFSPTFNIPMEYKNAANTWVQYWAAPAARHYYHATRTTTVTVGGVTGSVQGPWQAP